MSTLSSSRLVASPAATAGTSAPVLEFLCLFTHDLRRKQKRWQDGRLKYHTFNKRLMVYDDRGNFIGDMHWRADWELDAGEELQLERGGVIVQVSDCVGQQPQDLSELVDKRLQEREQRIREKEQRLAAAAATQPSRPTPSRDAAPRPQLLGAGLPQIRHRPLTSLVGTPTGHHGRAAVPSESPFEQRQRADDTPTNDNASRAAKRRRYDDTPPSKLGYAQSLFGTTLTLSGAPPSSVRLPSQPAPEQVLQRAPPARVPPPSSPEAEARNVPPSGLPPDRNMTTDRSPLRAIDDRRTNLNVSTTRRPLLKEQPVKDQSLSNVALSRSKRVKKVPSPRQWSRPVSLPGEITDLTLSDDDGDVSAIGVADHDGPARPGITTKPSTSALILDRTITKRSTHVPAVSVSAALGRNAKANNVTSQHGRLVVPAQSGAPGQNDEPTQRDEPLQHDEPVQGNGLVRVEPRTSAQNSRRTELRLKSRKKRGLLVVSEQAITRGTEESVGKPRSNEAPPSTPGDYLEEIPSGPKLDIASNGPSPASNFGLASKSLDTGNNHSENSLTRKPRQDGELQHGIQAARNGEDGVEETLADDKQVNPEVEAAGSVGKSRKRPKRNKLASVAPPVDEPGDEPSQEPKTKRHPKREPAKRRASAAATEDDTEMQEDGLAQEDSTGPPPAPRFVRLARKSVKSKELIGYNFGGIDTPRTNGTFSVGVPHQPRVKDHLPPSSPTDVSSHGSRTAMGKDADTNLEEAEIEDRSALPSRPDFSHFDAPRSPSPLQQRARQPSPLPAEVEKSVPPLASGGVEPGVDVVSARPDPEPALGTCADRTTRLSSRISKETQAEHEASAGQGDATKVAEKITSKEIMSKEVDGQLDGPLKEPPKLVNPATRGRKAALKSHAAGQVPQPVLPADVGVQLALVAPKKQDGGDGSAAPGISKERPKITMKLPGFVSAKGGGPWSREAHDLLETPRPS